MITLSQKIYFYTEVIFLSLVLSITVSAEELLYLTPPSTLHVYHKTYNLTTLQNPLRANILAQTSQEDTFQLYQEIVTAGHEIYFSNCFYCHGDLLNGEGPFAKGLHPPPSNFQTLKASDAYLFWRITTGGAGLPKENSPWNSAMPAWQDMLNETEVWQVITFLNNYIKKLSSQGTELTGKEIYLFRCAVCHGKDGTGEGQIADFVYPRPHDFSMGSFKYKTSPGQLPARDEDLFKTIKYGLNGTAMPAWGSLLSDTQIKSLIPVIKSLDGFGTWEQEEEEDNNQTHEFIRITESEPIKGQIPYSEHSLLKGKIGFEKNCKACHGELGRGNITSNRPLSDDWGYRLWPRDLTKPWTWRMTNDTTNQEQTIRNIYQRLSIGIFGTPMPPNRSTSTDPDPISLEDRWHIANYVYSLRNNSIPPTQNSIIKAIRTEGQLPSTVDDLIWNDVPGISMHLIPNVIKEERLFRPLANAITVRVLYNTEKIAFLLEIHDRTDSRPGETVCELLQDEFLELFSDAFAIQFPKKGTFKTSKDVEKPFFFHGDTVHHTTILYWNAGSIKPKEAPQTLIFEGQGLTLTPQKGSFVATGKWEKGQWRVLMTWPRQGTGDDLSFTEGQFIPISFANWDGSNEEVGSKHTLTRWYWLLLSE